MGKSEERMGKKQRLVLIDGHAILFRSFYAFPYMSTPDGLQINAVYGFALTLLRVIEELEPTHLAVCFDSHGPTFREEQYKEYKANREKPPDEFIEQMPMSEELVRALNIPQYAMVGWEADDLIGTLAEQALLKHKAQSTKHKSELETLVVTADMDMLQLVDNRGVFLYRPARSKKPAVIYDEETVIDDLGLRPDQVPDMKGLAGDSSDNIPGIKGIGPKTAARLLAEFETVEGVYEYLDEIIKNKVNDQAPSTKSQTNSKSRLSSIKTKEDERLVRAKITPSVLTRLVEGKELAVLSKELATIRKDAPIKLNLDDCRVHGYDKEETMVLLDKLGFESLKKRLPEDEFEMSVQDALF